MNCRTDSTAVTEQLAPIGGPLGQVIPAPPNWYAIHRSADDRAPDGWRHIRNPIGAFYVRFDEQGPVIEAMEAREGSSSLTRASGESLVRLQVDGAKGCACSTHYAGVAEARFCSRCGGRDRFPTTDERCGG